MYGLQVPPTAALMPSGTRPGDISAAASSAVSSRSKSPAGRGVAAAGGVTAGAATGALAGWAAGPGLLGPKFGWSVPEEQHNNQQQARTSTLLHCDQ